MEQHNPNAPDAKPEGQRSLIAGVLSKLDAVHQVWAIAVALMIFFTLIYTCWQEHFWRDTVMRFTCPFLLCSIGALFFVGFRKRARRAWPKVRRFLKKFSAEQDPFN